MGKVLMWKRQKPPRRKWKKERRNEMAKKVSWTYGGKRYSGTFIRETKTHKFARTKSGKIKKIAKRKK